MALCALPGVCMFELPQCYKKRENRPGPVAQPTEALDPGIKGDVRTLLPHPSATGLGGSMWGRAHFHACHLGELAEGAGFEPAVGC
jgi:hypothetical protein